ncbi:hypothetical protein [Methylobacterium indicum]|uniref:Uncharacterized protein n=1 Tax=Methylobacterium indicum TaxID=1775910 RepID=A0A8H8WTM5_9HYPH|nr:hypothetical protein [Methylobacterium indicum]BCM84012.1 hypothetical protein mvi_24730 [Methylobacterium indicum]
MTSRALSAGAAVQGVGGAHGDRRRAAAALVDRCRDPDLGMAAPDPATAVMVPMVKSPVEARMLP